MEQIFFNNIRKTTEYLQHLEFLFTDYALFRSKHYSSKCLGELNSHFPNSALFLTHSGTGALEMIAQLMDIEKGDEVIFPAYTFVSTVNAFVSKGAVPVFVDVDYGSWNIGVGQVEKAITEKTKAIVAVHYAGHAAPLTALKQLCEKEHLLLVEDAAMAFGNFHENQPLGSVGDFGIISFDITKQITAIQGGLLLVNNADFKERANHIYHIGTNRTAFIEGNLPYYEWVDVGGKYQMNELNAAVLWEQLRCADDLLFHRKALSQAYDKELRSGEKEGLYELVALKNIEQNIHTYYILTNEKEERIALSAFLKTKGIESFFHYVPLHTSVYGKKVGRTVGEMNHTEKVGHCLLRLPLHSELDFQQVSYICSQVKSFYDGK